MAIDKVTPAYFLGANLINPKVYASKINEIIDALNTITDGTYNFTALTVGTLTVTGSTSCVDISSTGNMNIDQIAEYTVNNGVDVDGVLIKDSTVKLGDGTVSDLSVKIGADSNNGLYGVSDTQLGFAVEGALKGGVDTSGLFTDIISEQIATNGVTIDSTLLKDGGITTTSSSSAIIGGLFFTNQTPQTLTGAGAVNLTTLITLVVTTGADALTLAAGTTGQHKIITMKTDGGDGTLTPTGLRGGTTITFNDVGDTVHLLYIDSAWIILSNFGCTVA